jgi:hypothetical protein
MATLACVAFLGLSAGTAEADYAKHYYCKVYVAGVPDCKGAKVCVELPYKGVQYFGNGDSFVGYPYYPIKWRAVVGKFYGPWMYGKAYPVNGRCVLDVRRGFCKFDIVGIPARCNVAVYGMDGLFSNNATLCLPVYAYYKYKGVSGDVRGPWHSAQVNCKDLDVTKKFCTFTVKGIPTGNCNGVVDIKGIAEGCRNDTTFCAPNGVVVYCRARLADSKIVGPWHGVNVWCLAEALNVAQKFAKVCFKFGWSSSTSAITEIQDSGIRIKNGGYWCFPKYAKVYARPSLNVVAPWERKAFYDDACVIWKLFCVTTKFPEPK